MPEPRQQVQDKLIDRFGRHVNYIRISVTDRCDFRCVYCMSENMQFVPRAQLLTLEEIAFIAQAFTELGVRKIRITGGEPLIRRNIIKLFRDLGQLPGLQELVTTTNGSQLAKLAPELKQAGVKRINISLDSLGIGDIISQGLASLQELVDQELVGVGDFLSTTLVDVSTLVSDTAATLSGG